MNKKLLLISYDLCKPERDYESLIGKIRSTFPTYNHVLKSVWLVETDYEYDQARDILKNHIDKDDKLLVVELTGLAAWTNLDQSCSKWLSDVFNKYL